MADIGLYDVDSHNFPNLPLMKLSAWHKAQGDNVEWYMPLMHYPELTKDTAYGFLTRGCCNNCDFCIVSEKEGRCSVKVADLSEFWDGQKYIKLLDPNLLACKERMDLIQQLVDSGAWVDFSQGLDARFITPAIAELLKRVKTKYVHFAFDRMKYKDDIIIGLDLYKATTNIATDKAIVYMLTNYDTTPSEDMERIRLIRKCGYLPDVRIYRKHTAPQITRDLQRWCNNRRLYRSTTFAGYIPRVDGRTVRELYPETEVTI